MITLDTTLADDVGGGPRSVDTWVDNLALNNHAACGYLRASPVRARVTRVVSPISA